MNSPTHATVATFRVDMSREEEQRRALREFIIPGVRRHPGFLRGYWMLDRDAAESVVVLTYSSRDSAEQLGRNIEGNRPALPAGCRPGAQPCRSWTVPGSRT
jgi:hypothetical protein